MDGDGEDELVVFSVHVVEVVPPDVFDVARIDESMTVWSFFDEHHGW